MKPAISSGRESVLPLVSVVTVVRNRAEPLRKTIESIKLQTYGRIEYIVIDGASTDQTIDVLEESKPIIDVLISEPDKGIYDAINKGVSLASGDYICLLHAGDQYSPDFIEKSVAAASGDGDEIVYSSYRHGNSQSIAGRVNDGILLHHLNIVHLTFLVPRDCYQTIGPYDTTYKIAADILWIRRAYINGVRFKKIEEVMYYFAPDGASSAQSTDAKNAIISENIDITQVVFPDLPREICASIYLSRFNDKHISAVSNFMAGSAARGVFDRLSGALSCMYGFLWKNRRINLSEPASHEAAKHRVALAKAVGASELQLGVSCGNLDVDEILTCCDKILKRNKEDRRICVHFLQVFSRETETFVYDLLGEMDRNLGYFNVVLCDQRVLAPERPYENVIVLDYARLPEWLGRQCYRQILGRLNPQLFIAHFAINGWHLFRRLDESWKRTPTLFMTHGIDVFTIPVNESYRKFILEDALLRPNVRFTGVSDYLIDSLKGFGVPGSKISKVRNAVNDRFFANRKESQSRQRDIIKVVSVGRFVPVKGRGFLLRALLILLRDYKVKCHLTLVGGAKAELPVHEQDLVRQIEDLGAIEIVPFVNFDDEPDYYSQFDMLVSSSVYDGDAVKRSESFGMSILEGIAAGLPVVVTDAGGSREVVGCETEFSRLVPAADAPALARSIKELAQSDSFGKSNRAYAVERVTLFSRQEQLRDLSLAIGEATKRNIRVAVFSTHVHGGAGAAAARLHKSLLVNDVESRLVHATNVSGAEIVNGHMAQSQHFGFFLQLQPSGEQIRKNYTIFTLDFDVISKSELLRLVSDVDVINLHWYARMLSVENIAFLSSLGKPVVFTIRDMFPLSGGCHYFHECEGWKSGCNSCPQLLNNNNNLPHLTYQRKLNGWARENISVVTLSSHTADIVRQSPLFRGCRIDIISNGIDTDLFNARKDAAEKVGVVLAEDKTKLLYLPSYGSSAKGHSQLRDALSLLASVTDASKFQIVLAGAPTDDFDELGFEVVKMGFIDNKEKLAGLYTLSDITLVPSLEETFSNTTAESIACGTPVVGFQVGAIAEMASSGRGIAVEVGNVAEFCGAILEVASWNFVEVAVKCRAYAEERLHNYIPGGKYKVLFNELLSRPLDRTSSWRIHKDTADRTTIRSESAKHVIELTKSKPVATSAVTTSKGVVFLSGWSEPQTYSGQTVRWTCVGGRATLRLPRESVEPLSRGRAMVRVKFLSMEGFAPLQEASALINGRKAETSIEFTDVGGVVVGEFDLQEADAGGVLIDLVLRFHASHGGSKFDQAHHKMCVRSVSLVSGGELEAPDAAVQVFGRVGVAPN